MQERDIIQRTKSHKKWILALIERPTYLPLYRHLTLRPSYYTSLFLLWSQSVCRKREMANMSASTASLTNSLSTMSEIFSKAKQHFMKTQMRGFLREFHSDSRRLNYSHKMSDKWWCTGSTLFRWFSYQIECILFSPNFATSLLSTLKPCTTESIAWSCSTGHLKSTNDKQKKNGTWLYHL